MFLLLRNFFLYGYFHAGIITTLMATSEKYFVFAGYALGIFVHFAYIYVLLTVLSAFVGWYRGIFWFNPNMQNSALG